MTRHRLAIVLALTMILGLWAIGTAFADTATTTRADGYQVSLTGPATATVGVPATFTATCGPIGWYGSPCPYGEFRAFGGPINRLGEGFGTGAMRAYTFRAPATYQIRYRVGASCPGSPRLACPIDTWLYVVVT
jgi:hypothetical protein